MKVLFKKLHPDAVIPKYATPGAAGADLVSLTQTDLGPGDRALISTGLGIELEVGLEARVQSRSGLAWNHGVAVLNSPGCIDSDYRGEIRVLLINHGTETFYIKPGDRVAQLIISPVIRGEFVVADELSETKRGNGGFGSTGQQ